MFFKIKLKKSEKRIIKIAVFIITIICVFQFAILPLNNSYKELKERKKNSTATLTKFLKKIKESKNSSQKLNIVKNKLDKYKHKVFEADSLELAQVDLEEKVADFAKNNELEIKRRYQQKASDVGQGYSLLATRFTVAGKLENIVTMMKNIQDDPMIMYIAGFTIRSYKGYEANLEIRGLIKRGAK